MVKPIIENNVVTFANGKMYNIPWAHADYCYEYEGKVLLILGDLEDNQRNIWCFDQNGNKLWEIEPGGSQRPYHHIEQNKDGELIVSDQSGAFFRLDEQTGFVEYIGGDQYVDGDARNIRIRQQRDKRLREE